MNDQSSQTSFSSKFSVKLLGFLMIWLAAASAVGARGVLETLPLPPPAIAIGLTLILLVIYWVSSAVKLYVKKLGLGPLVAFHLIRIAAGGYFLILYNSGQLMGEFALPAGIGDIFVGVTALLVLLTCIPAVTTLRRRSLLLWNAFGLLDILLVLANGIRLLLQDSSLTNPFTSLPLALLPLFVIPIVLFTHVILFVLIYKKEKVYI